MEAWLPTLRAGLRSGTEDKPAPPKASGRFIRISLVVLFLLAAASWWFIFFVEDASLLGLFSAENRTQVQTFVDGLLGVGVENPAFLDLAAWRRALDLTYLTLQMSVLAIGIAGLGMLITVIPGSRTAADGSLTLRNTWYGRAAYAVIRAVYVLSRAVPELIWAMIIVFIFKPGVVPGALALGLHNFGILGKLCAEIVEGLDLRPARSIRASGGSTFQMLIYAVLPQVTRPFLTYLLYRWEVVARTTIIVGFVGAAGLGREFHLAMSWFHYTEVTLLLICYILLVFLVDLISGLLRRLVA